MKKFIERRKRYVTEIPFRAKDNMNFKLRKILYPYVNYKIQVEGNLGEKYLLSEKSVDDKVLSGLLDLYYDLYFPKGILKDNIKIIWDLGAHHGFYTIRSLYEYPGSRVIAVEPNTNSFRQIERVVAVNNMNGRVTALNTALSHKNEMLDLFLSDKGSWGDSLYLGTENSKSVLKIETITFDDLLEFGKPDIIKCNAEGAEYILINELERNNIKPLLLILMVHPEFGNPAELLAMNYFDGYSLDDTFSTPKRLRYLLKRKK